MLNTEQARALIQSDPWLIQLSTKTEKRNRIDHFMHTPYRTANTSLYVEELTGNPADVIVGHPWLLHATTHNCGKYPRMMCVHKIHLK